MPTLGEAERIAIWGFGREGRATLDFLASRHPRLRPTILADGAIEAPPPGVAGVLSGAAAVEAVRDGRFSVIVKSPGISLYRPEVAEAKARGTRFTSATNLWFAENPTARTIAVTGTKGKSTTARLLHHVLVAAGRDAVLLGNVGIPTLGQAPGRDWTVLEVSSYQAADLDHGPDIALVTNLYPEHAPWHGSVERYYADKLRLLRLDARTVAFCNHADRETRARLADPPNVRWFEAPAGYHVEAGALLRDRDRVDVPGFPLPGAHNLTNLAAVLTVAEHLGLDRDRCLGGLAGFRQLPHRLEETRLPSGVLRVDDSISTIPEATIAALDAYPDRDTVLLLGGTDRGQDYTALYARLPATRVKRVVLLPPNGERIFGEMTGRAWPFEVTRAGNLAEAVSRAFAGLTAGDLVLLSPAAPSFGEFRDFEERGSVFKALCELYGGANAIVSDHR